MLFLGFKVHLFFFFGLDFILNQVVIMITRFDIDGHITGFGHPDWVKTHEKASWTSPVVSSLVEGGATCSGKTVVDELAYGYLPSTHFVARIPWAAHFS